MTISSLPEFIQSTDPLSENACGYLLDHKEENTFVDYKENFDSDSEKCWCDIAIDVVAFSNTHGGYLVFGIKDKTYDLKGLSDKSVDVLCDIKVVLEKINRGVQPKFTEVRTRRVHHNGLNFVVLFAPQTKGRTHVFEQNLDIHYPGGKPSTVVKQGSIYVRNSGSNAILTSNGFEELISRRIQYVRDRLMEGISRVVHAEPNHEIVVVSPEESADGQRSFRVTDASDAVPVKGVSLAVVPTTTEEEIAGWIAFSQLDPKHVPTKTALMKTYSLRNELKLLPEQQGWVGYFSLVQGLPSFYWFRGSPKANVASMLNLAFEHAGILEKVDVARVAAFLDKDLYKNFVKYFSKQHVDYGIKQSPRLEAIYKCGPLTPNESIEEKVTQIAKSLTASPDIAKVYELQKLDCSLYAPFR